MQNWNHLTKYRLHHNIINVNTTSFAKRQMWRPNMGKTWISKQECLKNIRMLDQTWWALILYNTHLQIVKSFLFHFFLWCWVGIWTQGFVLAKQVLYQLSYIPRPPFYFLTCFYPPPTCHRPNVSGLFLLVGVLVMNGPLVISYPTKHNQIIFNPW